MNADYEIKKDTVTIDWILNHLKEKHNLNDLEYEIDEALNDLQNLDLYNETTIAIILATPTQELIPKFQAIVKWVKTEPFMRVPFKKSQELRSIYTTKIKSECKNKCFEIIWNHPDHIESLGAGIHALYSLKAYNTSVNNFINDIFQISYLDLLDKYPHGAEKIGKYFYSIGYPRYFPGQGGVTHIKQNYLDTRRLELEAALAKADEETQNAIFDVLYFHDRVNTNQGQEPKSLEQEHLEYSKSLSVAQRILLEEKIFEFERRQINRLIHQYPKHARIITEEIMTFKLREKEQAGIEDVRLINLKEFFCSLQEKLKLNGFNYKPEKIKEFIFELRYLLQLNWLKEELFSDISSSFQNALLEKIISLKLKCVVYIKNKRNLFTYQPLEKSNEKFNLNRLPREEFESYFKAEYESKNSKMSR